MWQDYLIAFAQWTLAAALVPTILSKLQKPTLSTSLLTAAALALMVASFASLSLWTSAVATASGFLAWCVLAYQRYQLNKKSDHSS